MEYVGWAFWFLNALVSLYFIYHWSTLWNANGVWGLFTSAAWIWIWQALGVGLVPLAGWSPWHLLWWFPLGCVVSVSLWRILRLAGVVHLQVVPNLRWRQAKEMDIDSSFEIRVRDPLNEVTRKERRSLLGVSTLGIIMAKTGLIPEKITTFGVEFTKTDQKSLLLVVAFIVVYFFISFVIYAWSDFVSWRIAVNSARQSWLSATAGSVGEETKKIREFPELSDKIFDWGQRSIYISWVRSFWEFLFPLLVALCSTYFLVTTNPVGMKPLANQRAGANRRAAWPIGNDRVSRREVFEKIVRKLGSRKLEENWGQRTILLTELGGSYKLQSVFGRSQVSLTHASVTPHYEAMVGRRFIRESRGQPKKVKSITDEKAL